MNIPNKIRVGSIDYDVELTDEILVLDSQQSLGIIDYDNTKIKIAQNIQSQQKQEQTFLHELVHAITREFKIDFSEDEEVIVDKLAYGLHQLIRDNLPCTIKIGTISVTDGVDFDSLFEKFSEKLNQGFKEINKTKSMSKIDRHPMCGYLFDSAENDDYSICESKETKERFVFKQHFDPFGFTLISVNDIFKIKFVNPELFKEEYKIISKKPK